MNINRIIRRPWVHKVTPLGTEFLVTLAPGKVFVATNSPTKIFPTAPAAYAGTNRLLIGRDVDRYTQASFDSATGALYVSKCGNATWERVGKCNTFEIASDIAHHSYGILSTVQDAHK